ncbi:MAG: hypothetical protein UX09_C0031G0007 [Candidatus Uhrbacteria bacterium GW2011_GWE2_45_35]|uniref:Uncharacterized protein n=2 Tax=Candidatus Uhriibacteriota TaxID=1752732 RepID=A0A0G1MDC2_9BACT|nr:MAG: hypothetical protein UW63_C0041G0007 [Candidatus Uhrbacteria bacterium GW2011_GWF2_44_350]KKU07311.1 MAG: hypothetical protein UX09_C0031G0007 [Candidatus Uhrbacteria bacterium GW2011_GWE2_45_35]
MEIKKKNRTMPVIYRILLGFLIIAVGAHMIWKTGAYQTWTGPIQFAEEKIGTGGTSSFLKILGMLVCFIGMAVATDLISDILNSFAGLFIRG